MIDTPAMASARPGRGRDRPVLPWSIGGFVLGAAVALLTAGALAVVLAWPHTSVVRSDKQPPTVSYADQQTHYVVVKKRHSWGSPLFGGSQHELWIGPDPSATIGHVVELEIGGTRPDRLTVTWRTDGVSITFERGHRLEVPASAFTGGR